MKQIIWEDAIYQNMEDYEFEDEAMTEDEKLNLMWEWNAIDYEAEHSNLDNVLNGEIVCFATLNFWDGRRSAYRLCGNNLNAIIDYQLDSMSYLSVYTEDGEVCASEAHHDGTNYYTYRLWTGDHDVDEEPTEENTVSLYPYVAEVYGW